MWLKWMKFSYCLWKAENQTQQTLIKHLLCTNLYNCSVISISDEETDFQKYEVFAFFGLFGWCSVLFKFGYPCKWFKVENYATWQRFDQLLSRQPASAADGLERIQPRITCSSSLLDDLTFPKQCFVSNQKVLNRHGPSLYSCFSFITWQDWVEDSRALEEGKGICEGRTLIPKWLCGAENPHPYLPSLTHHWPALDYDMSKQ